MKIFLTFLLLILIIQSWSKADEIMDFEIEGISVGDSLLHYFKEDLIKEEMNSSTVFIYKDNKFIDIGIGSTSVYPLEKDLKIYEDVGVTLIPNDKKYIIYGLDGTIYCKNIDVCLSQKEDIKTSLISFLGDDATFSDYNTSHQFDKTGNSKSFITYFEFKSHKSIIRIVVTDWSNEMTQENNFEDNLKVEIISSKLNEFLSGDIYD